MMGQLYPWTVVQGYVIRTFPVEAYTTSSGTQYKCNTSGNNTQSTGSITYRYVTTLPQSKLQATVTLGQCQQLVPSNVTLKDSLGNQNSFTTGLGPSPVCGYGQSCPTTIVIYLS